MMTEEKVENKDRKGLHITLWIVQILLAGMFLMAGFAKLTMSHEAMIEQMQWPARVSLFWIRIIAACEVLGALGLILPSALRIYPKLTAWAASGLADIMLFAMIFHAIGGEMEALPMNFVLLALSVFVIWGRFKGRVIGVR